MDLLRIVVKKRSEDHTKTKDSESLGRFATRVAKLRGEGPMATSDEPEVALEVISINISDIEIPPHYARKSQDDISALSSSIKVYGIQQPVKVVKLRGTKKYRLVFGRRRLKAALEAGLKAVPCIVELATQEDRLQMLHLVENLHRSMLSAMEEAEGFNFLVKQSKTSIEEICKTLGIKTQDLNDSMELITLPENMKKEAIKKPDIFSKEILKTMVEASKKSKVICKKLFNEINIGNVKSNSEAIAFITDIS